MPRNSPSRHSGTLDNFYDPDFTAQISSKMQVPDKISVIQGDGDKEVMFQPSEDDAKMFMHVPERIIVAGGDEHIAGREPLPELRLETNIGADCNPAVLTTPPRVLTLNKYTYPAIDMDQVSKAVQHIPNSTNFQTELNGASLDMYSGPKDDISLLRTQMKFLTQRIAALEMENQTRQQRELILYSVGVIYFLFKGMSWLRRQL